MIAETMIHIAANRLALNLEMPADLVDPLAPIDDTHMIDALMAVRRYNVLHNRQPHEPLTILSGQQPSEFEASTAPVSSALQSTPAPHPPSQLAHSESVPLSREQLFDGQCCPPSRSSWSHQSTLAITNAHWLNDQRHVVVGITKNGKRYHHVSCFRLCCGQKRGRFHGSTIIQLASQVRAFNASRRGTPSALTGCISCQHLLLDQQLS